MQMWMLVTHGTRCPSLNEIDKIVDLTNLKEQILNNHEIRNGKYAEVWTTRDDLQPA